MKRNILFNFSVLILTITSLIAQDSTFISLDTISSKSLKPFKIDEINNEIEKAGEMVSRLQYSLESDESSFKYIESKYDSYKGVMQEEIERLYQNKAAHYSKYVLDNTHYIWKNFDLKLLEWQEQVNEKIKSNHGILIDLDRMEAQWTITLKDSSLISMHGKLKDRIEPIIDQVRKLKTEFNLMELKLVDLENKIAERSSLCSFVVVRVSQLKENLRDSILIVTSTPLLKTPVGAKEYLPIGQKLQLFWHMTSKIVKIYFYTEKNSYIFALLLICFLIIFSVRYSFSKLKIADSESFRSKGVQTILFDFPILTILSLFLINYRLFFPIHPLVIGKLIVLFLLISSRYFLAGLNEKVIRQFISRLIILLTLNYLQFVFWYFGNVARYYIFIEEITGLILTYSYIRPAFWKTLPKGFNLIKTAGILSVFIFIFFLASLIANLFGLFDLAILLIKIGFNVPAFTVILFSVYKIWLALTSAVLLIAKASKQNYLTHYWEKIEKRAVRIVFLSLLLIWLYFITRLLEISDPIFSWINEFLITTRTVGTLNLTIGSVITCIVVLIFTFFLTGVIRFIIDDEFIHRSKFPRGVIAAISVSIRYIIIVLGIMFALSAAGIDLGKFGLLAGALGVGIGFGLQNIVNNFISGLILVYERPIQVGDAIEVQNLLGKVTKIGLRSSHVITYDGAEVVVPNGNLVSNQLINWTLTDNQRRIEIKVGTAYGTDPNIVVKLLEEVVNENKSVLKFPVPLALFDGFGDNSLNFRLLFWVFFDDGLVAKSNVSIAIYNKLKGNNIEIPFPQLDLHIKNNEDNLISKPNKSSYNED